MTKDRVRDGLKKAIEKAAANQAAGKKFKVKAGGDLRKSLATFITEVPPVLVDHTLQANGFDVTKTPTEILESEVLFEELFKSLGEARQTVENITASGTCKGYIFAKYRTPPAPGATEETPRENLLYEDFHPFCPQKLSNDPEIKVLEFDGYNQMVDEFFSSLEGQKLESKLSEREATAQRRIEAAKQEQTRRIEGLQEVQATNFSKAAAIEANVQRVQEAMDAVNGLLAQGMDWVDVSKLVEREKKKHNPVAEIIKTPLKLDENLITLTLAEEDFEEEEDDPFETDSESEGEDAAKPKPAAKGLLVDINLSLSPWSNAREYYEERRSAAGKEEKTQAQSAKALKNTEKKINEDLKKGLKQEKALLQPIRKQMWFEKFIWFISSDGYLVLGGKDATQNEMLYKRYLRKGDVYCHADMHGASSVIIKNNPKTPDAPIPPSTLTQAGTLSVCTSSAWDSKAGMGAWWVNADQVSKSAPTGEFLPQGSFMIKGSKNFLPAAPLLMGLGFLFRISEESKARHVKHRLHDEDTEAEPQAISAGDLKPESEAGEAGDAEADDASMPDDHSDNESADGRDDKRDNPLQFAGNGDKNQEDDVDEVEGGVSDMKLDDKPSNEDVTPENEENDNDEAQSDDNDAKDETPSEAPSKSSTAPSTAPSSRTGPPKRGKKGKAKKIAAKYKNQDEEDRLAAEALIGATTGKQKADAEAKAKADREAEAAFQKERRRAQHQKRQKETAEHEEIRKVMMEEGVEMLEDDEAQKTTSVDDLVGTPLAGDEIVEVIPVCAPWNALGTFKYKAKLQPGAVKKGKAVKEVLERFKADSARKGTVDPQSRDSDKMWPREVELIKGLKPEEIVNSVPVGKVRVMLTGGGGGGGGKGKGGAKGKGKKK